MDQLVRNAPFGTDFTPQPKWRLGKRNENYYSENRPTQGYEELVIVYILLKQKNFDLRNISFLYFLILSI